MWALCLANLGGCAPVNLVSLGRNVPSRLKFDVFGKTMVAESSDDGWQLFVLGADGKRSRSEVVVPDFIREDELEQFLDDLFHEMATRERPSVRRIPD